jgi:4-hydroxybenzoate polyprenyltransferase
MLKVPIKYLKPLDYLFILRPTLFFPVWIITFAGYSAFSTVNGSVIFWQTSVDWMIVFNFFILTLAAGATFILNQLQDVETDRDNKKLFLVSENYVQPEKAKKIAYVLIAVSLVIYLVQGILIFVALALFLLLWGYLYNFPPFRWKDHPISGIITNLIGGIILFLIGWLMAGEFQPEAFLQMIPYLFAWGSVALLTTLPDEKGDSRHEKETFAIKYGRQATVWTAFIWVVLAFAIGMLRHDPIITHPVLLSLPLYVVMLFKPNDVWVLRTIRYPLLFIGLMLCVQFPYFFIVLFLNFYISKFYYINRFNLDYPTFKVEEDKA